MDIHLPFTILYIKEASVYHRNLSTTETFYRRNTFTIETHVSKNLKQKMYIKIQGKVIVKIRK